jgi:DNA-binding transcriptional regulator YhcF (GntR family)
VQIDNSSPIPVYAQIEQLIEQLILRQQLSAHELVPSVSVLAKQLKVAPLTVQRAYRRLQERGLIYSIAGKGSFVSDASDQQFVGILVHNQFMLEAAQAPTLALLIQAICQQLAALRIPVRILTDTCPHHQAPAPISPDVMSSLEHGRPIGMILVGHYGSESLFDLAKARSFPVIGVNTTSPRANARVVFDQEGVLRAALAFLHERRKIREAAIVWLDQDNGPAERLEYLRGIERIIVECGMKPNPDWIIGVHQASDWAGYHACNHLCSLSPRRPQGLVVMDDVIGRGVHMGVLARQVRVPQDLLIVVQTNEDSPIVFPEQWQQCGYNLGQCGQQVVQVLQSLLSGEKLPAEAVVKFPFKWHGASPRSPWNVASSVIRDGGRSRPMFQSGRQALETV